MNTLLTIGSLLEGFRDEELRKVEERVDLLADFVGRMAKSGVLPAAPAGAAPAAGSAGHGSFPGKVGQIGDLNGSEKVDDLASKQGGTAR